MVIQITPRNLIYVAFKRKWTILTFIISVTILTILYFVFVGWRFQSDALLVVNLSGQDLADAQLHAQGQTGSNNNAQMAKEIIGSMAKTAASSDIEKATVAIIGAKTLYPKLPSMLRFGNLEQQATDKLEGDYSQTVEKDSNALTLSYINDDPEIAQKTLKTLVQLFMQKQATVERDPRKALLDEQLAEALKNVNSLQRELLAFRQSVGITDLTTERALLLNQRDDIEEQLNQSLAAMANAQKSVDSYKEQLSGIAATVTISDQHDLTLRQLDTAKAKWSDAEQSLLQASQTYTTKSPLLADARAVRDLASQTYSSLKAEPTSRTTTGPNPTHQAVQQQLITASANLAGTEAGVKTWRDRFEHVQKQIDYLNRNEADLVDLTNQLAVAQTNYQAYLKRTEEARITEALNRASAPSLAVAQEPTLPYKPVHFTLVVLIALGVAVFGGVGLALGLEVYDEKFGMPEDVRRVVGLPVLVSLGQGRESKNARRARTRAA